jgi:hypothetical protein
MTRKPLPALMFALLAGAGLGGCSNPPPAASTVTADAEAPPAVEAPATSASAEADVFRFRIGELDAVALKDGDIDVPNDGGVLGVGQPVADIAAVLADAGLETGTLHLSIQPLLVRAGARVLLFDTAPGTRTSPAPVACRPRCTTPASNPARSPISSSRMRTRTTSAACWPATARLRSPMRRSTFPRRNGRR